MFETGACNKQVWLPGMRSRKSRSWVKPLETRSQAVPLIVYVLFRLQSKRSYARCGDKGSLSNIAVFARVPDDFAALGTALQPQLVADYLSHLVKGPVVRYEVPGLKAFNFALEQALDGGRPMSLRPDPLGKGMARVLLDMEVVVPR